ncbi:Protein ABHD13 (Alpha/beta hydrolase domain-containing protein 13) (Abhydrolase domain-containing protein 13) [Durusdinium trenchii]|uniref:Protein ABHD13 (Alpha/beta hydrolase domain-containing protein 13) (Abhydrolase domain-containing protein 13) n=1 Tax=Durusdinium trenchii TaxID=1381693 RepID=A0ABP0RKS4_9DINO
MYWKVVGGAEKGGILVREGEEFLGEVSDGLVLGFNHISTAALSSPELGRLSFAALVTELGRSKQRLHFKLVAGTGRPLAMSLGRSTASAALLLWRQQRPQEALQVLESEMERPEGLEELHLALERPGKRVAEVKMDGRWPEAAARALQLRHEDAQRLIDGWRAAPGRFAPSPALFWPEPKEVMPGICQIDDLIPIPTEEVKLGVRFFLQSENGRALAGMAWNGDPEPSKPMVLYFHGNAETVDTYTDEDILHPLRVAPASTLVVDFRGYGYSTGHPSLGTMSSDGERVVEYLPTLFQRHALPWPWPGGLYLLGRSMGGIVACHLAALKADLFQGVILESTLCGSHAPGASAPEEPPQELEDGDSFVHLMASEDKIRAFTGRLLILHGELDTLIPVSHARRLLDAAEYATRRLVTVSKGHNDISTSDKYVKALKQFLQGG